MIGKPATNCVASAPKESRHQQPGPAEQRDRQADGRQSESLAAHQDFRKDDDRGQHGIKRRKPPEAAERHDDADGDQHVVKPAHEARRLRVRPCRSVGGCRLRLDNRHAALSQERQKPPARLRRNQPLARRLVEYRLQFRHAGLSPRNH
jgi:hypothetical protein